MFTEVFTRLAGYFLPGRPNFHLESFERDRVLLASFLPFVVVSAMVAHLYVDVEHVSPYAGPVDEGWARIGLALSSLTAFAPFLAVGFMFMLGLRAVTPAEASWYLLLAGALSLLALGFGMAGAGIYIVQDPYSPSFRELRADTWVRWASDFGVLVTGYAFLAYRGLATAQAHPSDDNGQESDMPSAEIPPAEG